MASSTANTIFHRGFSKLCWHRNTNVDSPLRVVYNNASLPTDADRDLPPQALYKTNRIKTTKYTVLTFFPRNLFEQFHRFANIYFLFIALLNFVPEVNAFAPGIALIPVVGVLAVTALKDGYEDYRRYKQDKKVNFSECRVYKRTSQSYERKDFYRVLVGDIIRVKCNEVIPADLMLLAVSENSSTCFIETANLDGESNLKQRTAVVLGHSGSFNPQTSFRIECEAPNAELNKFNGFVEMEDGVKKVLSKDNLLLRGCVLRNTDFVEGIVIYAGHDTRAMKNSSGPRYKRSKLERHMNRDVLWCLVLLLFMCFFSAIGSGVWLNEKWKVPEAIPYIPIDKLFRANKGPAYEGFVRFWTFVIIYQVTIPLSLYATLEIVKSCQVYFIHIDRKMYYDEAAIQPVCRAFNITEDLGQVQHIFSDKTGTLTENKMLFKACSIGDMIFREDEDEFPSNDDETALATDPMFSSSYKTSTLTSIANNYSDVEDVEMVDEDRSRVNEFLVLLATCNTVVVSSHSHNTSMMNGGLNIQSAESVNSLNSVSGLGAANRSASMNTLDVPLRTFTPVRNALRKITDKIRRSFASDEESDISLNSIATGGATILSQTTLNSRYEAESPDELALVKAVCKYGCRLLFRSSDSVSVHLPAAGGTLTYQVLAILPFDSVRKCMSVVMRSEQSGEIFLYTKGADNIILDKVINNNDVSRESLKNTRLIINHFAKHGLRTLCMAKKVLGEAEFRAWLHRYDNCDISNRDAEQFELCNELETDLQLLGSTGIEDKLQDGVAESVRAFENAGIKVWVLTGDKQETAINIGYSCGLLPQDAAILTLNVPNADEVETVLRNHLVGSCSRRRNRRFNTPGFAGDTSLTIPTCLVVDGKTLSHIFSGNLSKLFLRLADNCLSVLCCRTTPSQKARIVELVKVKHKTLTLAIGDGANDVNMIRTANVGVGIEGLEGKQASMAADFSIGRFKHLVRLLFVHGHWTYDRLAVMTLYNFFKNSNLVFTLFWFQIFCMFSGQNHIDQIYLIVFHLLFTSLPPLIVGVLDQDLPDHILMDHPRLYQQGPQSLLYHRFSYWIQIVDSIYQSLVIFFTAYMHYNGSDIGIWSFGTLQAITLVTAQLFTMMIETRAWHWPYIASNVVSFACFWTFLAVLGAICVTCSPPTNPYWVMQVMLSYAPSWLYIMLGVTIALIPRVVCTVLGNMLFPTEVIHTRNLFHGPKRRIPNLSIQFPDD